MLYKDPLQKIYSYVILYDKQTFDETINELVKASSSHFSRGKIGKKDEIKGVRERKQQLKRSNKCHVKILLLVFIHLFGQVVLNSANEKIPELTWRNLPAKKLAWMPRISVQADDHLFNGFTHLLPSSVAEAGDKELGVSQPLSGITVISGHEFQLRMSKCQNYEFK